MPMTTHLRRLPLLLCLLALVVGPALGGVAAETVASPLGALHLVRPEGAPKGLILFLSGAPGWDAQAMGTAREAAGQGYLVAGVPWPQPLPPDAPAAQCRDLGADLDRLADWIGAREDLPKDARPVLLGESEGAALAYAALLQSPPRRFHAALTRGFCPRWPAAFPPPCRVGGLTDALVAGDPLRPAAAVPAAWYLIDAAPSAAPSCPPEAAAPFAERVANAHRVGAGTAPSRPGADADQGPLVSLLQWLDPRIPDQVAAVAAAGDVAGLPLIEVRAPRDDPRTFAVMVSGDGGWAALDRGLTARLADRGISTVGWDALSYFWKPRTPAETGRDLTRVLRHYLDAWHKERVILIGYSFGAEVLPFMAAGLPPDLRPRVVLAAFLGLGRTAMFEFHLTDWLGSERGAEALPVLPAVTAMDWTHGLCVYGAEEEESLCPDLAPPGIRVQRVPGDHHFDEDYPGVADLIIGAAVPAVAPPP